MTAHPPSDPAAEAVSALREALITARETLAQQSEFDNVAANIRSIPIEASLAPLLADIAALRTRAEEAEKRGARDFWEAEAHGLNVEANLIALARMYGEACGRLSRVHKVVQRVALSEIEDEYEAMVLECEATEDDRDRLATELAEARAALEFYAQDEVWRQHGECNPEHAWFTGPNTARRALTTAKGDADVEA